MVREGRGIRRVRVWGAAGEAHRFPTRPTLPTPAVTTLHARPRPGTGRLDAARLRAAGRVPATILGLPGGAGDVRVSLPAAEVRAALRAHGRRGLAARLFDVRVRDKTGEHSADGATPLDVTHRVLPRQVHVGSVSGTVENVNFIAAPPGRRVAVRVPVRVLGDAIAPGVKRGGFLNLIRRDVRVVCGGGDRVPPRIDVDASKLDLGDRVPLAALTLPPGVELDEQHADLPVLKIAGRQARE